MKTTILFGALFLLTFESSAQSAERIQVPKILKKGQVWSLHQGSEFTFKKPTKLDVGRFGGGAQGASGKCEVHIEAKPGTRSFVIPRGARFVVDDPEKTMSPATMDYYASWRNEGPESRIDYRNPKIIKSGEEASNNDLLIHLSSVNLNPKRIIAILCPSSSKISDLGDVQVTTGKVQVEKLTIGSPGPDDVQAIPIKPEDITVGDADAPSAR